MQNGDPVLASSLAKVPPFQKFWLAEWSTLNKYCATFAEASDCLLDASMPLKAWRTSHPRNAMVFCSSRIGLLFSLKQPSVEFLV